MFNFLFNRNKYGIPSEEKVKKLAKKREIQKAIFRAERIEETILKEIKDHLEKLYKKSPFTEIVFLDYESDIDEVKTIAEKILKNSEWYVTEVKQGSKKTTFYITVDLIRYKIAAN